MEHPAEQGPWHDPMVCLANHCSIPLIYVEVGNLSILRRTRKRHPTQVWTGSTAQKRRWTGILHVCVLSRAHVPHLLCSALASDLDSDDEYPEPAGTDDRDPDSKEEAAPAHDDPLYGTVLNCFSLLPECR
jgi:hypothetical protein